MGAIIRFEPSRRATLVGLGTLAAAGGLGVTLKKMSRRENATRLFPVPNASRLWRNQVDELYAQLSSHDYAAAAQSAGYLTDEAFTRADRVVETWLAIRKSHRGLLPKSVVDPELNVWNYRDCAADMFGHFIIEASLIGPRHLDGLRDMLARERALAPGLPQAINLDTGEPADATLEKRIFGAVEYAKDGLLPVLERIGPNEYYGRMRDVVDAIIVASPIQSRFGRLPSDGTEKNGEFLQVLARLYQREKDPRYLTAGRALADAYTQEVLPYGHGLPTMHWDFKAGKPLPGKFRVRDHGNEIIAGLAEWVMAESVAPDSRAERYRPAVEQMMDTVLDHARDTAGLWDSELRTSQPAPAPPKEPTNDNWGYLAAGYVGYARSLPDGSPRRQRYLAEMTRAFSAATQYRGAHWERGQLDGYSDTIESAQYVLPYLAVKGAERWIDDQTGILMAYQKADGFVGGTYLDGNFVRTALLYALYRTQGARLSPWRPGVRLGAIASPDGLIVHVASETPWRGKVIFDRPRHRDYLHLAAEYPRLNGWTEWFVADPGTSYEVASIEAGKASPPKIVDGSTLIAGLDVELLAGSTTFKIRPSDQNKKTVRLPYDI